jgi:cytidylate kinase
MIITLSGIPGAGKSTLKNKLAEALNLKKYSVGDMRGKMAEERGLTIDELNTLGVTEAFTDKEVDAFQTTLGEKEDNFVIDGRLSWYFIPKSVKIFLNVDPDVAAKRMFLDKQNGKRPDEPDYGSVEETKEIIKKRLSSDQERFKKWYGVDFFDQSHYDLVLDTTNLTIEEKVKKVLDFLKTR